jgi:hypothetical protein
MKVFSAILIISLSFLSSCEPKKVPFSEQDIALVSQVFAENQILHEGLLSTPPKLSLDGIKSSIESLSKSTHPLVKEWKEKLSLSLPKNPKDIEASYEDLSKLALILVEIKKEVTLPDNYQQFYCPMVEKYWVAKDKEIRNPYAPEMRDCGEKIQEN